MNKFLLIYCSLDERLLNNLFIVNLLSKHNFKPSKDNPRLFYKKACTYGLNLIQKDISFFWYEKGKRKEFKCREFDSYVNGVSNNLDWLESCGERNKSCGY